MMVGVEHVRSACVRGIKASEVGTKTEGYRTREKGR